VTAQQQAEAQIEPALEMIVLYALNLDENEN
jgi:hypothetical protein